MHAREPNGSYSVTTSSGPNCLCSLAPVRHDLVEVDDPARIVGDAARYLARYRWVRGAYYDPAATVFTPAACLVGVIAMVHRAQAWFDSVWSTIGREAPALPIQPGRLHDAVRQMRTLLLAVDGPVCGVFAGHRARVAGELLEDLAAVDGAAAPRVTGESRTVRDLRCYCRRRSPGSLHYMPGEAMHQKGADGAQRAKRWLDATTRTRSSWTNDDAVPAGRMEFNWPFDNNRPFSFDIGGILFGKPFDHHAFMAEVKYQASDGLGPDYDDFLAKCYFVRKEHPRSAEQFMFLTWHPFRIKRWTKLCGTEAVVAGCLANRSRLLGEEDASAAKALIDQDVVEDLEGRLWLLVLSEKQEQLLMSNDDRALIVQSRVERGLM